MKRSVEYGGRVPFTGAFGSGEKRSHYGQTTVSKINKRGLGPVTVDNRHFTAMFVITIDHTQKYAGQTLTPPVSSGQSGRKRGGPTDTTDPPERPVDEESSHSRRPYRFRSFYSGCHLGRSRKGVGWVVRGVSVPPLLG